MATKKKVMKTVEAEPESPKVAGRGQKTCPECGEVVGARSASCPKCSHQFQTGEKKKAKPNAAPTIDWGATLDAINSDSIGGLKKLRATLETVERANEVLNQLGGFENAKQIVETVGKLELLLKK